MVLQSIMDEKNINIPTVARMCELSDGTVRSIIKRKQERVSLDVAFKMSKGLGVSLERLNGMPDSLLDFSEKKIPLTYSDEEDNMIKKYRILDIHGKRAVDSVLDVEYDRMTHVVEQEEAGGITYINCYDLAVSAGPGEPWGDDAEYKTRIEIPTEQVPENAHYCVRVNGNSMEPAFKDGDIVFVQRQDEMIRVGEIGIFYLNGDGYIKRLGRRELISLNPKYDPIPLHDYDDLRCQGYVLGRVGTYK